MMWATRNADNLLQGYKLNLQQLMGMKIPAGILNFIFKHSYCRKVKNITISGVQYNAVFEMAFCYFNTSKDMSSHYNSI